MTLKEYKLIFSKALSEIYPQSELDSFFYILMEEFLKLERVSLILNPEFIITEDQQINFKKILEKLKKEEPIQYIIGNTEFYGLPFLVDENTLIPRPETEQLVDWIIDEVEKTQNLKNLKLSNDSSLSDKENSLKILDIGTGTGCIPISLAKNTSNTEFFALDVSEKALKVAKKNALINKVDVTFLHQDILKTSSLSHSFDLIVSNPPYVRELEKVEIKNNVLQFEPHLALFVDDKNPLIFYNKIADLAKKQLSKNGMLFFEINQYLGKDVIKLLSEKGFKEIELKKDFAGNDRMVFCKI